MGFWQLGNTSVRSALRIRDGLVAYSQSGILGKIRQQSGDIAFRRLLGERGVVSLGEDRSNSVGRKWRAAMGKLGFIFPEASKKQGFSQDELGPLDVITPAGWSLIQAETVAGIQECYLRALATPLTPVGSQTFSPLRWTLALLLELERRHEEASLSFLEIALIVQTTTPNDGIERVIAQLLDLRTRKNLAQAKRAFDRQEYEQGAQRLKCKADTFRDYADMNIRYLKATGVLQAKGKGIALVPEKRTLAVALTQELLSDKPLLELYRSLCDGAPLPTDQATIARQVLDDLLTQSQRYGVDYSLGDKLLDTPLRINQVRYELEELIAEKKEIEYAARQAEEWREIAEYMDLIASKKTSKRLDEETEIRFSRLDAPVYLEWSVWRAFLAINTLANKPYEVRRFKIDQDFTPISPAPGNGPDIIAEFENFVIVIEVTLSENSRQEAMEGEPVRRHIADLISQYDKPIYGLFLANKIDSNTAETFRIGVWYTKDDERLDLRIVPLTLTQFSEFFKALFASNQVSPQALVDLLAECEQERRRHEAPQWKTVITEIVKKRVKNLANATL